MCIFSVVVVHNHVAMNDALLCVMNVLFVTRKIFQQLNLYYDYDLKIEHKRNNRQILLMPENVIVLLESSTIHTTVNMAGQLFRSGWTSSATGNWQ